MKSVLILALIMFFSVSLTTAQNNNNTFTSPTLGITLTKPAEWHFASAEEHLENIKRIKLDDEEIQKFIVKYTAAPLVAMTKYKEPYDDLNPSFKVDIKSLTGLPVEKPGQIIELILPFLEKTFDSFSLEDGPTDTLVSGFKASYIRVHYNLMVTDTTGFPACSEVWIVPKGSYFFIIGVGTSQNDKTDTREEISSILASIKIENELEE